MIFIRSLIFNILFYAVFILMMLIGAPLLLARRRRLVLAWVKVWAQVSVGLLRLICGTRVEFRNLHLKPTGASIMAIKHQSFLETFALIPVLDDFSYILKKELLGIPFFGWYVRVTEQIAVDRARKGAAVGELQRAVREKLAEGRQILIFPEGTRRPVGAPAHYKSGIAALCAAANVPCTPVALNTGLFWPRNGFTKRPGTVIIEFLPPISGSPDKGEFMQVLSTSIESASNALVAEALREQPGLSAAIAAQQTAPRIA